MNIEVLNQEQKTKLKVLEEAIKLSTVIQQAQTQILLAGNATPLYGVGLHSLAGSSAGSNSCTRVSYSNRIGKFSPLPPPRGSAGPGR